VSIYHTFNYNRDYYIPAEVVKEEEDERTKALKALNVEKA
jgi:cytochrome o ubiquinol oxidase subunit 1